MAFDDALDIDAGAGCWDPEPQATVARTTAAEKMDTNTPLDFMTASFVAVAEPGPPGRFVGDRSGEPVFMQRLCRARGRQRPVICGS
jgi:hypothetical protein